MKKLNCWIEISIERTLGMDNTSNLQSSILLSSIKLMDFNIEPIVELGRTKLHIERIIPSSQNWLEKAFEIEKGENVSCRTLALIYDRLGDWDSASKSILKKNVNSNHTYLF